MRVNGKINVKFLRDKKNATGSDFRFFFLQYYDSDL